MITFFKKLAYSFQRQAMPFRINSRNGVIVLSDHVDYEVASNYRFIVVARDKAIDR